MPSLPCPSSAWQGLDFFLWVSFPAVAPPAGRAGSETDAANSNPAAATKPAIPFLIISLSPPLSCRMISLLCFAHSSLVDRFHDVFLGVGHQLEHRQEILFSQNGHSPRGDGADGSVSRFVA